MRTRTSDGQPRRRRSDRHGFTLIQILVVMAIISVLAAIMLSSFSRAGASAARSQCDAHLKAIAIALDAYKQEHGTYPTTLKQLRDGNYLQDAEVWKCPADPNAAPMGAQTTGSYDGYYVLRSPHDGGELPIVVCPFHEGDAVGAQAYTGRYTEQFSVEPATLTQANGVMVQHPDRRQAATPGMAGMPLHGGDDITTNSGGGAIIQFADGSTATLGGSSDVTVLQSFLEGQAGAPLYTLLRQLTGTGTYEVHHGSKFDVATPTATAGALGTKFTITIPTDGSAESITVLQGRVRLSTQQRTALALPAGMGGGGPIIVTPLLQGLQGLLNGLL